MIHEYFRPLLAAALLTAAGCAAANSADVAAGEQGEVIAFTNVNVIPMTGEGVQPNRTVVVRDGRIDEIAPATQLSPPPGARVIAGEGKYLMPGLTEGHAHIPSPEAGEDVIDRTLLLYLMGGVTTIRGMQGHPRHLELREAARRGEILSPRIFTASPSLSGRNAPDPATASRLVRERKAEGYDFLKITGGLSRASFDAMDETADEVGIGFAGHVPADVGLQRALDARYASIDHLDSYVEALAGLEGGYEGQGTGFFGFGVTDRVDESRIRRWAEATRDAGVWNAPTEALAVHLFSPTAPEEMARWPEMKYMPEATVQQWVERKRNVQTDAGFTPERAGRYLEIRRRIIKGLHDAGAELILASDAPQWWNVPGFSARRELKYMVDAGLTPYEALETGTINAARYFGQEDQWGTVEEGKVADLILLNANPLADIENIWEQEGVMVRGRWLEAEEMERMIR